MIKVEWSIEEMVAIVAIYFKSKLSDSYELKEELLDLSKRLNKRANILGIEHDEKYRNYNGMKKMFENLYGNMSLSESEIQAALNGSYPTATSVPVIVPPTEIPIAPPAFDENSFFDYQSTDINDPSSDSGTDIGNTSVIQYTAHNSADCLHIGVLSRDRNDTRNPDGVLQRHSVFMGSYKHDLDVSDTNFLSGFDSTG